MNQLTKKIAAVALAFLFLGAVSVQAKDKKPKKKKNVDLSANPAGQRGLKAARQGAL
jgi:hypothetical protein